MSETGESGRARTDDPLLIGLDMAPCLTGVSPGYIAPQAAHKPRLSAGLYRRRRRGPPGPRCPILAESGWAARRQRAPKEARLRPWRLPASYGCDDLTADRRYRTGRGASVFPLRRYDGEIRTPAIKRGRAIVRSHEWLSIEAIVFDKDIEVHPNLLCQGTPCRRLKFRRYVWKFIGRSADSVHSPNTVLITRRYITKIGKCVMTRT